MDYVTLFLGIIRINYVILEKITFTVPLVKMLGNYLI